MFALQYKYGDCLKMYCSRDGMRMCRSFENHLGSEGADDVAVDLITSESTNYTAEGSGEEALSEWVAHRTAWRSAATACMNSLTTADSYNEKQRSGKQNLFLPLPTLRRMNSTTKLPFNTQYRVSHSISQSMPVLCCTLLLFLLFALGSFWGYW